jgi:hypothetical protein
MKNLFQKIAYTATNYITGECSKQPPLLRLRTCFSAVRLNDGRIVCVGRLHDASGGGAVQLLNAAVVP